ncbi:MAG: hypothetical protein M3N29_07785 [Chloroflexota bacterium]|nr:hypothetical protein [Chloroflexota bacterium]
MAILAGLASMLGRFAGRVLNTTLGWATVLLFGKVPASRQGLLLVIVFGALAWVALVVGVLVPDIGALLIAAVPLPDFVDENWVRLAMLGGAIVLPALIGAAAMFIVPAERRPSGAGLLRGVLRGYPFAAVLAVTIVVLAGVATVRKLSAMARRWETSHVPVIVKPGAYEQVLVAVGRALEEAGLDHAARPAGAVISTPPKLLDAVAGRSLGELVPDRLMVLTGPGLEVLVYPSDLAISGTREKVARARAAVVSRLLDAPAYMTASEEAQRFEDDLQRARRPGELAELDERLARLTIPFDEWETLYRQRLQRERELAAPDVDARAAAPSTARRRRLDLGIAIVGLGLILLDLIMLIARGRRRH